MPPAGHQPPYVFSCQKTFLCCRQQPVGVAPSSLADILGHHQCQHLVLRDLALATVLLLGLGVAFATGCDVFSDASFWHTQQAWTEFWNFVRLVCSQHGSVPDMLSLYAVEE